MIAFLCLTILLSLTDSALGQTKNVKVFFDTQVKGQAFFLKRPVIRIYHGNPLSGGEDATHVINSQVIYKSRIPGAGVFERASESTDAHEFKREAEIKISGRSNSFDKQSTVRFWDRGTPALVHKIKYKDRGKLVYVDVTLSGKSKSRIRLHFYSKNYTVAKARESLSLILAGSKPEMEGAERTVEITEGMTEDQVIQIQGKPKQRVSVGSKTVLVYEGIKLVFRDGKLVDVE